MKTLIQVLAYIVIFACMLLIVSSVILTASAGFPLSTILYAFATMSAFAVFVILYMIRILRGQE